MYEICYSFCSSNKVKIILKQSKNELNLYPYFYFYKYNYNYFNNLDDYFEGSGDIPTCMSRSGEGGKYAPINLKYCQKAYYYPENKTYSCISCYSYNLDEQTNTCKESSSSTCTIINKGTEIKPQYVCDKYTYRTYALISYDTGEKEYVDNYYNNYGLTGCVEAIADTTYYKTKYNCTKCSFNYILYYSEFFERNICQNLQKNILKQRDYYSCDYCILDDEYFDYYYFHFYECYYYYFDNYNDTNNLEFIKAEKGICEKDTFFTPDGEKCYKCDDDKIGMPGCKGSCIYSNKKEYPLKCTGECKKGYIEYSEGVCKECSSINSGCYECHYENSYPSDYKGIKRKRRFVCDYCAEGYTLTSSGECTKNSYLGLSYCNKAQVDSNNNDNYICTQCEEKYFINEEKNAKNAMMLILKE